MYMNNSKFCLYGDIKKRCMFDSWSLHHFYWQGLVFLLLHSILKINNIKYSILLLIILTILHIIEEYLGNNSRLSLEGIVIDNLGPLFNNKIKIEKRKLDNDTIRNSIGDVLSGILSNILILYYWYHFKSLPYIYILGIIPIYVDLINKSKILY